MAVTSFKLHESARKIIIHCIQNLYIQLFELLGILSKENNKLKNATDVFLHKNNNSVGSFFRGA